MNAKKTVVISLLALCACLAAAPTQASAAPAPAWKLTSVTIPTNLIPGAKNTDGGPSYYPIATNVGTLPTSGEVTLVATLPAGLTPVNAGGVASNPLSPAPACSIAAQLVTCKTEAPVYPGNWIGVEIGFDVAPTASGTLLSEATVSGGGAALADTATTAAQVSPDPAPFDVVFFDAPLTGEDGSAATQAGSHPTRLTTDMAFAVKRLGNAGLSGTEHPRQIVIDLPRGVIANPTATPVRCTEAQLTSAECPLASQVGSVTIMTVTVGIAPVISPLYNMVPPPGAPGAFAFEALKIGLYIHVLGSVRSDGDYGLSGSVNDILARNPNPVFATQAQLWGDPTSPVHDGARDCPTYTNCPLDPAERTDLALLSMPTECSGQPLTHKARASSWENPDVFKEAIYESAELGGSPVSVSGCDKLAFEPTIEAEPSTDLVDSPSGLRFNLHQPQSFEIDELSRPPAKDATVTLPAGMVANPSQADGLEACSTEEVGLSTAVGEAPIHFDKAPASCPDASKLGKITASTPLLEGPLPGEGGLGAVYLAEPFDNPFGSLLALYIVLEDPDTGTVAKLAGEVIPDPVTGQLATRFEETPQLPIEDFDLDFFAGPRAPLRTPPTCQAHTTTTEFTPWSAPETPNAHPTSSFTPSAAPGGAPCPATPQSAPHAPAFRAGTLSPQAGTYSPFVLKVSREDGSQELSALETTLPPGLSGKLAGIASCSEAAIAAARAREAPERGALELASPSCPAASEVGTVDASAGAGITPFQAPQGHVYRAGPYKGAPLSFVIITPAVAGPFDLGTVVVRVAAYVDPKTAQVRALTDPLPRLLEGIPLDLRSASLRLGRSQFILNPTSCDPMSIGATATSVFGQSAALASPFQAIGCQDLPFKPKLELRLLGGTKRGAHPRLRGTLTPRPGDANIARTTVALPRSEFLDQAHIRTVCTRVQFAAKACPKGAIYGHVTATTPLLDEPLEGPVYLRSSDNELPDAVAVLSGPDSLPVEIEVSARIDSVKGGIRANFETTPDAPITKVVVMMQGGRKGLLINSRNLCASKSRATVKMDGQNGKVHDFRPVMRNDCGKKGRKGAGRRAKGNR